MLHVACNMLATLLSGLTIRQLTVEHLRIRRLRTRPMASARNGRPGVSSSFFTDRCLADVTRKG
jgi:hypothetical protein